MTRLIADCGSTNCDWALVSPSRETVYFATRGINALQAPPEVLLEWLEEVVGTREIQVDEVHFYGAGCRTKTVQTKVARTFSLLSEHIRDVFVYSDIMAAVSAHQPEGPAYVGILGTGANLIYFDGHNVHALRPSLGYLLGDEGSGADLGRALFKLVLREACSEDLLRRFFHWAKKDPDTIIEELYRHPTPNLYLAQYAPFIGDNIEHPEIHELLLSRIRAFVTTHLPPISNAPTKNVYLVGGIAHTFSPQLAALLESSGYELKGVMAKPLHSLVLHLDGSR